MKRAGKSDLLMNVNATGVFFATQFARHLRETQRGGRIVDISSVHEEVPFPHFAAYGRDLAIELAPLGIAINSLAPGWRSALELCGAVARLRCA